MNSSEPSTQGLVQQICLSTINSYLTFQNMKLRKLPLALENVRHSSQMLSIYKHNLQLAPYLLMGFFFFLDKNLNRWNLEWNFKDFVPMRSYKIRKVESFKSGVLDIWIDIEYKPSCAGCICSFWTSWFVLPEVLCVCLRMQRQNPLRVSSFYWIQRPVSEQS